MTAIRHTTQTTIETAGTAQRGVPSSPQNGPPLELLEEIYPDGQPSRSPTPINDQDEEFESVEIERTPEPWYQDTYDVVRSLKNMHFSKPEVMIAVMGKTGTGKTSFINAVTGKSMEVGHGLRACTQDIQFARTEIDRRTVTFIDTPGFDDTDRSDVDILNLITAYLQTVDSGQIRLSGIIYLHSIKDTRMQGSSMKNIRMFRSLCGDDYFQNVILCTTGWHQVEPEVGNRRESQLKEEGKFWGDMVRKGARVERHHIENVQASATRIAGLLVRSKPTVLQIQRELENRPLAETSAGKLVLEQMEKLKLQHQEEMKAIKEELENTRASNNQEEIAALKKYYEKEIAGLKKAQEELEKLRDVERAGRLRAELQAKLSEGKKDEKSGWCVIC